MTDGTDPGYAVWTGRVVSAHESSLPDPLLITRGDELTVLERETEWEGWLWCANHTGDGGWMPQSYVRRDGARGTALRDYDATELTVRPGELLSILDEEGGWHWCCTADGRLGWVPTGCVERA